MGEKTRVCEDCGDVVVGDLAIENGRQVGLDFYCVDCADDHIDGN